jgi:hypothetical protein
VTPDFRVWADYTHDTSSADQAFTLENSLYFPEGRFDFIAVEFDVLEPCNM